MLLTSAGLRRRTGGTLHSFTEKALSGLSISCGTQEKFKGISGRIHCPVEVEPDLFDFDGGLIDFPGVVAGFQMRSAALSQFRCIDLNESDKWWCDRR